MTDTTKETTENSTDSTLKTSDNSSIKYKTVTYLGAKKKALHFTELSVDNKTYGDVIIVTTSELGSRLHDYVLKNTGAITVENVGENSLSLQGQSLDLALKDSLYRYFDDIAVREGYQSSYDLLSYINSENDEKKKVAVKFLKWRENALDIFDDLSNLEEKPDDYGIDYIVNAIGPFSTTVQNEIEQAEQELTNTENRINEIKNELLTATLLDDADTIDALKAEYKGLIENEEV